MSYKIKSVLYFASFVMALVIYYQIGNSNSIKNSELANNTTVQISTPETLN